MSGDGKQRSNDPESQSDSSRYIDGVHAHRLLWDNKRARRLMRLQIHLQIRRTAHQIRRRSSIVDRAVRPYTHSALRPR